MGIVKGGNDIYPCLTSSISKVLQFTCVCTLGDVYTSFIVH